MLACCSTLKYLRRNDGIIIFVLRCYFFVAHRQGELIPCIDEACVNDRIQLAALPSARRIRTQHLEITSTPKSIAVHCIIVAVNILPRHLVSFFIVQDVPFAAAVSVARRTRFCGCHESFKVLLFTVLI